MSAARNWHLRKEVKERKDEAGGLLKEGHPCRANNEGKCAAWNSASSVWATRRRKWDDNRVRIRGAAGDELRKEARDPSSRNLLGKVTEVDFILYSSCSEYLLFELVGEIIEWKEVDIFLWATLIESQFGLWVYYHDNSFLKSEEIWFCSIIWVGWYTPGTPLCSLPEVTIILTLSTRSAAFVSS